MAKRLPDSYLEDIMESIEISEGFVAGISQPAFEANLEKQDAVIRQLAIISELSKNVPEDIRSKYPGGPLARCCRVVVHEYFGVSLEVILGFAVQELPVLKA